MSAYHDALRAAMQAVTRDPAVLVVGYGLRQGASSTWHDVANEQLLEMPVGESLMMGVALGLALKGRRPLVWIERFDFALNAVDPLVNHIDKIALLSRGEYRAGVMVRVAVGNAERPLYTGPVHTQDHSAAMRTLVSFPVVTARTPEEATEGWRLAHARARDEESTMVVEYRDLY